MPGWPIRLVRFAPDPWKTICIPGALPLIADLGK
jgi:hypothetical protein